MSCLLSATLTVITVTVQPILCLGNARAQSNSCCAVAAVTVRVDGEGAARVEALGGCGFNPAQLTAGPVAGDGLRAAGSGATSGVAEEDSAVAEHRGGEEGGREEERDKGVGMHGWRFGFVE